MSNDNLWGEIPLDEKIVTPAKVLDEQAAALSAATKDILRGKVAREPANNDKILLVFRIVAPLVGNYQYEVCRVVHDIALYPLRVSDSSEQNIHNAKNEDEFKKVLATIFQKPRLRNVMGSLIAQSRG